LAHDLIRKPVPTFRDHAPGDIERPVVPKPLRGVDGVPVRMPVLVRGDVVGAIEVDRGVFERVLGNHERGEDEFRLSYE
jgi:hypothetical protein